MFHHAAWQTRFNRIIWRNAWISDWLKREPTRDFSNGQLASLPLLEQYVRSRLEMSMSGCTNNIETEEMPRGSLVWRLNARLRHGISPEVGGKRRPSHSLYEWLA